MSIERLRQYLTPAEPTEKPINTEGLRQYLQAVEPEAVEEPVVEPEAEKFLPEIEPAPASSLAIEQPAVGEAPEFSPQRAIGKEVVTEEEVSPPVAGIKTRPALPQVPAAATALGAIESLPLVGLKGVDTDQLKKEFSGSYLAGQVTGTIIQGFVGAPVAAKGLAVIKSPLLRNMATRAVVSGGLTGIKSAEEVAKGRQSFNEAFWNTVQAAGAGAISVVPELSKGLSIGAVKIPWQLVQLIGQPAADLAYDATVDQLRGKEVGSKNWWKQEALQLGLATGFALQDVASGKQFVITQAEMRKDAKQALTKMTQWAKDKPDITIVEGAPILKGREGNIEKMQQALREQEIEKTRDLFPEKVKKTGKETQFIPVVKGEEAKGKKAPLAKATEEEAKELPAPTPKDIEDIKAKPIEERTEVEKEFLKTVAPKKAKPTPIPKIVEKPKKVVKLKKLSELAKTTNIPEEPKEIDVPKPDPVDYMPKEVVPGTKKSDPEFTRRKGFASVSGSIGGEKQVEIKTTVKEGQGVAKVQQMFNKQRKDVKDKFGFNKDRFIDKVLSKTIDVDAPWKRRILKSAGGKQVVMSHDLSRGASAEALRKYEIAHKEVYENVPHKYQDIFDDYIQAKRTIELSELKGEEFKSPGGLGKKDMETWLEAFKKQDPKGFEYAEKTRKKYVKTISTDLLNRYVDEGLMTRKLADKLLAEHQYYSPKRYIQHLDPDMTSFDSQGRIINVPDSGLKALDEGSEQSLINNSQLLMGQVLARGESRIFRNRANKSLYEFSKQNPDNPLGIKTLKPTGKDKFGNNTFEKAPTGQTIISAMIGGKRQAMLMPTEMAQYWVTFDPVIRQDLKRAFNVMSGSAILKPMATGLNPAFAIANLPRDLAHSWFVSEDYSPILPIAWAQQAKDLFTVLPDVIKRKGRVEAYTKEGGGMDMLTRQGQITKKPWEKPTPLTESINQIQKYLGWAGETSELWTRIALRERALKSGRTPQEATWVARTYLDFAQGGSWAKGIDAGIPYFNAGIQGTRGIFRAYRSNPKIAVFKTAQLVGFAAGLAYWNKRLNEEAYDSISDREKATKFIMTTPLFYTDKDGFKRYIYFGIPKDQGQRLFAMIGEQMINMTQTGKVNFEALKMAATDFIPVDAGNILPPTMSAFMGYVFNKDFWRNENIWKGRRGISPKEEFWNSTPKAWVVWGDKTSLSPERSKRAFHKVVPQNAYTYMLEAFVPQLFGNLSEAEQEKLMKPFIAELSKIPLSRRIVRETWPQGKKFDELLDKANEFGLETNLATGKPMSFTSLKQDVEREKRKEQDTKMRRSREFDKLYADIEQTNPKLFQKQKRKHLKKK